MTKVDCVIFLCGYIWGLASKAGVEVDPIAIAALRAFGCPEKYLPKAEPGHE